MAALGDTLYFETPDCHLVALDIRDGKQRWNKEICDMNQFYYGSVAPVVIKNHVMTGVSGDDMDNPGYLEAHDPSTGETAMALVHRAAEDGRTRLGDLAQRRGGEARRRDDLAAGHLRSGAQS